MAMALLGALAWNLAHASKINDLRLSSGATGTRAEIVLDGEAEVRTLSLSGPDRLVVDLPGSELAANLKVPGGAGIVKAVRTGHPVAGTTRIVFDLAQPVAVLKPRMESG
ncbi:AMIN domain-containing protein, partial [Marilutibacter maris]